MVNIFLAIFFIILCIFIVGEIVKCIFVDYKNINRIKSFRKILLIVEIVLSCLVLILGVIYVNCTAAGSRALKTQKSNLSGGLYRVIKVYDVEGDLISEYEGKFDLEYDDDRILFDDEDGNRHIIFYPTGTVTIDEKLQ